MSAPNRVPTNPTQSKHYASPPRRSGSWRAERPGETLGAPHPTGPALGNQGPDQGYALKLAEAFRDRLVLAPGEHAADALAGGAAVGLRRASLYGRGPISDDVEVGLRAYGFLNEAPPELVKFRRWLFPEVHHTTVHYFAGREIAAQVREDLLRLSLPEVTAAVTADWRQAFVVRD